MEEAGGAPSCCGIQSPKEACEWPGHGKASKGLLLRLFTRSIRPAGSESATVGVRVDSEGAGEVDGGKNEEEELSGVVATMAQTVAITARSLSVEREAIEASEGVEEVWASVGTSMSAVDCRRFFVREASILRYTLLLATDRPSPTPVA